MSGSGPPHDRDDDAVDRYLDEMFDRLAGTGARGRRALAEAEDHLRATVADAVARGLPVAQAEHDAVTRFGPPALIAGQLRRAGRGSLLGSVLSGAWVLAGLGLLVLGLTYLAKAVELAVLLRVDPPQAPACSDLQGVFLPPGTSIACTWGTPDMRANAVAGLVVLLTATAVLLVRRLVVRATGLAPAPRRFPLVVAAFFGILGFLFVVSSVTPHSTVLFGVDPGFFGVPMGTGLWPVDIAAAGSLLAAAAALVTHLTRAAQSGDPAR
ncbi:MAG TPA: permease prefix domain 1-containing protein [Micromonosporaceae bacterium]|nr:permease prefix domain 1-containing protein [Micromonosporaceae bacterium]